MKTEKKILGIKPFVFGLQSEFDGSVYRTTEGMEVACNLPGLEHIEIFEEYLHEALKREFGLEIYDPLTKEKGLYRIHIADNRYMPGCTFFQLHGLLK